jgi:hypothetical protein
MDHGGRPEAPRPGMQVALWVGGIPLLHSQQPWRQSRATQTSRTVPAGERARQLSLLLASAGLSGLGIVVRLSTLA